MPAAAWRTKPAHRPPFNDEAGLKVLDYWVGLVKEGLMPVTDQTIATFIAGNLGMLVDSSFQRVNTPKQAKFPVRLSGIPTPDGKPPWFRPEAAAR